MPVLLKKTPLASHELLNNRSKTSCKLNYVLCIILNLEVC